MKVVLGGPVLRGEETLLSARAARHPEGGENPLLKVLLPAFAGMGLYDFLGYDKGHVVVVYPVAEFISGRYPAKHFEDIVAVVAEIGEIGPRL